MPMRPAGCVGIGSLILRGDDTGALTERSLLPCGRFALFFVFAFGFARRDLAPLAARFLVLDFFPTARFDLRAIRLPQELSTTPPFTCSTCPLM